MKIQALLLSLVMVFAAGPAQSEDVIYVVNAVSAAPESPPEAVLPVVAMLRSDNFAIAKTLRLPPPYALDVAVTPDKSQLWVTVPREDSVHVIDAVSLEIIETFRIIDVNPDIAPYGNFIVGPMRVTFSPDGSLAFVTVWRRAEVAVYSTSPLDRLGTAYPLGYPTAVEFNPTGTRAYVLSDIEFNLRRRSQVAVIDTAERSLLARASPLDGVFHDMAMSPDGSRLYIVNRDDRRIEVVNTSDLSLLEPIPTLGFPKRLAVSPDGNYLFVGQQTQLGFTVRMLRIPDRTEVSSVVVQSEPSDIAVTETGDGIVVADSLSGKVYAFHVSGERLIPRSSIGPSTIPGVWVAPGSVAFGEYPSPAPVIRVNGIGDRLNLTAGDSITLSLDLDNNGNSEPADWWLVAFSPYGVLTWTPATGWTSDRLPAYQGPLAPLRDLRSPPVPVAKLLPGRYRFYFGVDLVMDGSFTRSNAYYDFVDVSIGS